MSNGPATLLALERAVVGYGGHGLLPPVDLALEAGDCWALIGRNGAGKSTLMRSMLGLQPLLFGTLRRAPQLRVAFVPQRAHFDLSVPSRVRDFVAGGLDVGWRFLRPWIDASERRRVEAILEETDTATLAAEPFSALSEGQKQRALIARALVSAPQLLVLDEPSSAMDPLNERAVFAMLQRLCRPPGGSGAMAVLLASHQMGFLPEYADHCLLVDKDLSVLQAGSTREVYASAAFSRIYGALRLPAPGTGG